MLVSGADDRHGPALRPQLRRADRHHRQAAIDATEGSRTDRLPRPPVRLRRGADPADRGNHPRQGHRPSSRRDQAPWHGLRGAQPTLGSRASRRSPTPRVVIASPDCPAGRRIGCSSSRAKASPIPGPVLRAPADSPGLAPVKFDIALKRGVVVRGRVTDKATGKPVPGCVESYTFGDNPHVHEFPGYSEGRRHPRPLSRTTAGTRSSPCPAAASSPVSPTRAVTRCGVGAEAIKGADDIGFDTVPSICPITQYHALAEVNIDPAPSRRRWTSRSTPAAR